MTLAVYLSSPTAMATELAAHAAEIESAGITVVSRWLYAAGTLVPAEAAARDLEDLRRADTVVTFTGRGGRGGRHVEVGVALERGLPIVVVGPAEHVFHYHPLVTIVTDWSSAVQRLRALATLRGASSARPSA